MEFALTNSTFYIPDLKNSMYELEMSNFSYLNEMTHVFPTFFAKIQIEIPRETEISGILNSEIVFWYFIDI